LSKENKRIREQKKCKRTRNETQNVLLKAFKIFGGGKINDYLDITLERTLQMFTPSTDDSYERRIRIAKFKP
jgi:hypothetical protein